MDTIKEALHELNEEVVSQAEFINHLKTKYGTSPDIFLPDLNNLGETKFFKSNSPLFWNGKNAGWLHLIIGNKGYRLRSDFYKFSSKDIPAYFFSEKALENLNKIFKTNSESLKYIKKNKLIPSVWFGDIYLDAKTRYTAGDTQKIFSIGWRKNASFGPIYVIFYFNKYGKFLEMQYHIDPISAAHVPFNPDDLDNKVEELVSILKEIDTFISSLNTELENFDTTVLTEDIKHLKASDFKKIKLSDIQSQISKHEALSKVSYINYIKELNEFLTSDPYFEELTINLTEDNLSDFIVSMLNKLSYIEEKIAIWPTYICSHFAFWEAWLNETFEIDIMNIPKLIKVVNEIGSIDYYNKVSSLTKDMARMRNLLLHLDNASVTLEEGITSLGTLHIHTLLGTLSYLILPSTLIGEIKFESTIQNLFRNRFIQIVITPIKSETGELISPFVVSNDLAKLFKNQIYFLDE